jgi:hypothetical protein
MDGYVGFILKNGAIDGVRKDTALMKRRNGDARGSVTGGLDEDEFNALHLIEGQQPLSDALRLVASEGARARRDPKHVAFHEKGPPMSSGAT